MQLADQAVVAAGLTDWSCICRASLFERCAAICGQRHSPVPVSGLDGSAVENEDKQQQTNGALKVRALVL